MDTFRVRLIHPNGMAINISEGFPLPSKNYATGESARSPGMFGQNAEDLRPTMRAHLALMKFVQTRTPWQSFTMVSQRSYNVLSQQGMK